jgi:hypothetical protein
VPARSNVSPATGSQNQIPATSVRKEGPVRLLHAVLLLTGVLTAIVAPCRAQTASVDQKGVAVLQQVMAGSGAATNPIGAFTATGTITYYWAGQPVQGSATIRARGSGQFRLDASLPDGTRSYTASQQGGSRKSQDGKLSSIPAHNTLSTIIPTLPYPAIAAALSDPAFTITSLGLVNVGGTTAYQIRVTRTFAKQSDPDGTLSSLSRVDYFIDPQTFLVLRTEDLTHPVQSLTESYSHSIEFASYTAMSGVAIPTVVREKVAGQTTWEFRLLSITLNPSLQDADFVLQ